MKHLCLLFVVLPALLFFAGCTSMQPVAENNSFPTNVEYEILGRVSISTDQKKSGYSLLLEEAQRKYPAADDVLNIMIDAKVKNYIIFKKYTYEMTAIAVDYK